ncbi:twin-arginine translocase subunit TatC [Streptomyces sp. URMC 123]|uniref:twin-arginine translocase subunit TatC n=1 Tax=Streptomyces sp. URMC 123 TaxID=3423403 RepID=UPI003F1E0C58
MLKSARKQEKNPEGRMPLAEHLRELRNRLAKAMLAILLGMVVCAFFYREIINLFTDPVLHAVGCDKSFIELTKEPKDARCANIAITSFLGPFTLMLKVSLMAGFIVSAPVWLYQLWAFLAPGLHRNEKRYTLSFVAAGFPLFLGGGFIAYKVLPTTAEVLISFTPDGVENLMPLDELLDIVTRMVVVFGLAFELPLLLVLLNFGGVISGKRMLGWWRGMIMSITIFAAVATPSTEPVTMLALAVPIWVLYFVATIIALLNDSRRRARDAAGPADDEASELDLTPAPLDGIEPVSAAPALSDRGVAALPEQQSQQNRDGRGPSVPPRGGFDDAT